MDRSAAPSDRAPGRSEPPPQGFPPLVVGRAREQAVLRDELAAAIGGRGRLVLVGGEAGIGRTTLARDLSRAAGDLGVRVLAGSCFDLTNTPPYGPWLDLFEECRRDSGLPAPPAAFAGGRLAPVTDQAALFAEVRRFLAEVATAGPALVLFEDLHWADPASVDLLRHVGPYLRHWPLLLLASYRVDELTPARPFAQQMPALVREAEGQRLDLRRLDGSALRALVAARYRLERAAEDRLVAYLERHAEGNPFFATELLRTLEEETLLRRAEDGWALAALERVSVPSLLRQVIDGRAARLGETTRKALALAAVIGQEVPLALWADVADLGEEALLDTVEQAVEAHLLEAERDGIRVRFVHALTREALYEGILPPRRRVWHRRIAEILMANPGADPDAVAFHLQEAGDPRAWEWLVKAGDRAQRSYAWLTAAERLQAAIALLERVDGQERMQCWLACRISYLKRFSDLSGAIASAEVAERTAARIGDATTAAEMACIRGGLLCYADRFRAGCAEIERGLAAYEAIPLDQAQTLASVQSWFDVFLPTTSSIEATEDEQVLGRLRAAGIHFRRATYRSHHAFAGDLGSTVDADERFAALVDEPGARGRMPAGAAFAYHRLGILHAAMGRPDAAHRAWARSRELFATYDHHALVVIALLGEMRDVAFTYGAAEPALRRRLAGEAEAALGRAGGALRPGLSPRLARLGCFALDGRWDEARRILDDLPSPGIAHLRREVTGTRALLGRHRGEPEVAWAQIRPLFPDGPATEPGDIIHQEGLALQRLAAGLCLDAGDLPAARAWLEAHDRWLAWSGSVLGRADGQVAWERYHRVAGDSGRARAAAAEALALAESPPQPLVGLAAHRCLGEVETAAKRFGAAEAHLQTALDLAGRCDVPFERALTMLALAELRFATGMADEAATLLDEVRRICAPLGAVPALTRADALATLRAADSAANAGLTERELDVLRLLPEDLTLEEIAARLFVSYSTVKTHLDHIRNKFGVNQRREVVGRAAQLGLLDPPRHPPFPRSVGDG